MAKEVVGKFNESFESIDFYEIMYRYKRFTLIRQLGTDDYYIWESKNRMLSKKLTKSEIPRSKKEFDTIFERCQEWYIGLIFFWSDSKLVTEYGLPGYDKLVKLYKELLSTRYGEIMLNQALESLREQEGWLKYLMYKSRIVFESYRKRRVMRKMEKEFDLIW